MCNMLTVRNTERIIQREYSVNTELNRRYTEYEIQEVWYD